METKKLGTPTEKYRGQLFRVMSQSVLLPNSKRKDFEYVERGPGTRVLVTDGLNILLIKEWRIEINDWDYRLPGGKVFDDLLSYTEALQDPHFSMKNAALLAAQRELKEETGLFVDISHMSNLHISKSGATILWDLYYFVADAAKEPIKKSSVNTDEGERIQDIDWFSPNDVLKLCTTNLIQEDRTSSVLMRYIINKTKNA